MVMEHSINIEKTINGKLIVFINFFGLNRPMMEKSNKSKQIKEITIQMTAPVSLSNQSDKPEKNIVAKTHSSIIRIIFFIIPLIPLS